MKPGSGLQLACLALLGLALLPARPVRADAADGLITALTNTTTRTTAPSATNAAPVVTNAPVATNAATATTGPSGATVRALFLQPGQGKFSIAGRVLALPAQDPASTNAAPSAWRRAIDCGMNMTRGNSETLRYTLGLDVVRERDDDLVRFHAQTAYGKSDDTRDTENSTARSRYERRISTNTYALVYADWFTDSIAEIDYRITAIGSPGWHLLRSSRTILSVEAGAGYLEEKKRTDQEGFAAGRLAASIERLLNAHVLAWCSAEYIPKLSEASIFFVNAEAGIASMLARNLSVKITVEERYDSAPASDRANNDLHFSTALSLNF